MNFYVQVKPSKCDPVRFEFFESDVEILITLYKKRSFP